MFYIRLLGPCSIGHISADSGRTLSKRLRLRKSWVLLAYLALERPAQFVPRAELADFLWGIDIAESSRRSSLRQCVRDLRVALTEEDDCGLEVDDRSVRLNLDCVSLDAVELRDCSAREILEMFEARDQLRSRVTEWSRTFLAGEDHHGEFVENWLRDRRAEFSQHLIGGLEDALTELAHAARWTDVEIVAALALETEPWNEVATRLLMKTTASNRGAAPALEIYDGLRAMLRSQMETEPSRETTRLAEEIRAGRGPDLDLARSPAPRIEASSAMSGRPSKLAVLPPDLHLDTSRAAQENDHLWLGATEELRTKLANFRTFSVLSSSVGNFYAPRRDRIRAMRDELDLKFVIETQIFPLGSSFRMKVDLVDTEGGVSLVHKSFDFHPAVMLDELEATLGPLALRIDQLLTEYEIVRSTRKSTEDMDAFDWWARARAQFHQWSNDSEQASERYLAAAIAQDPAYGQAHSNLSSVLSVRRLLQPGVPRDMGALLDRAIEHGREGVRLDPDHARCHVALGWGLVHARKFHEAAAEFSAAVSANPYDTDVLIAGSVAAAMIGASLTDEGLTPLDLANRAISLCTTNQPDYYHAYQAMTLYLSGQVEESVHRLETSIDSMPATYGWLAAGLHELGRTADTREAAAALVDQVASSWTGEQPPTRDEVARWFWDVTPLNRSSDRERLARALSAVELSPPAVGGA